ncbi:MAG: S-adenosylmethionine:tRNA ribosyltransferase-isomerase, partial [Chloroflexota bacterium]
MKTDIFDYHLPPERIAQHPIEPRHDARLLVLHREHNCLTHTHFYRLGDYLKAGDVLVINQTRVIPARIFAFKSTGGKVEILLLRRESETCWEGLVGGKKVNQGARLQLVDGPMVRVVQVLDGARRILEFENPVEAYLHAKGQMPLPPYIHQRLEDPERYQTVYASQPGSAAAPTAGLHFTSQLIAELEGRGIQFARITLHVGLDTFSPVSEDDPREHQIHSEWCEISTATAQQINAVHRQGGKVVAVGTTSV